MGFFDKIKDAAGKGAAKAEDLAKTGKLKFEIMALNSRIKDKKGMLGETAYSLFKKGFITEPRIKDFVSEIDEMLGQIEEKEAAVEKLGTKKPETGANGSGAQKDSACSCGSPLGGDVKYCPRCGAEVLRCGSCGSVLKKGEAFCTACGTKV